jgi:hypothetical protein
MKYYSAIKENKVMPFAEKWMELEIIMLSEISQTQKDKILHVEATSEEKNGHEHKWETIGG